MGQKVRREKTVLKKKNRKDAARRRSAFLGSGDMCLPPTFLKTVVTVIVESYPDTLTRVLIFVISFK